MKVKKGISLPSFFILTGLLYSVKTNAQQPTQDKEWELAKFDRYEKKLKFSMDSLKLIYRNRWSVGFSFGGIYMPGYTSVEKDYKTGVDMRHKHSVYMFSLEYYLTNITRVGIEAGWQALPQKIESDPDNGSIKGGGGINVPVLAYAKRDLFGGVVNRTTEELKSGSIHNRPSFFIMAAAGVTFTNLVRVRANRNDAYLSWYKQTPFTSKLGIGMYQRVGRIIGVELIANYQFSSNYSPRIGSVSSYSGFGLSTRFSVIGNGKFSKVKKQIDSIY